MNLDNLSKTLVTLILFLRKKKEELVSEIWIPSEDLKDLQSEADKINNPIKLIERIEQELNTLNDERRKKYYEQMISSLRFQVTEVMNNKSDFDLSKKFHACYGIKLDKGYNRRAYEYNKNIGKLISGSEFKTIEEFYKTKSVPKEQVKRIFQANVEEVKSRLPKWLLGFQDRGFNVEVVQSKPWTAFNYHLDPFHSKIELNTDTSLTSPDLFRMAFHEGYGGHHAELSLKDRLLVEEGRGEHGFVLVYSPQVFISEALAERGYDYFFEVDDFDKKMAWNYDRLLFSCQNMAAQMYWTERVSKDNIFTKLSEFNLSTKSIENILNFATDPIFGTYAPVYDVAYHWLDRLLDSSENPEGLLEEMYTQPTVTSLYD